MVFLTHKLISLSVGWWQDTHWNTPQKVGFGGISDPFRKKISQFFSEWIDQRIDSCNVYKFHTNRPLKMKFRRRFLPDRKKCGPTLSNEYRKTLPFTFIVYICCRHKYRSTTFYQLEHDLFSRKSWHLTTFIVTNLLVKIVHKPALYQRNIWLLLLLLLLFYLTQTHWSIAKYRNTNTHKTHTKKNSKQPIKTIKQ